MSSSELILPFGLVHPELAKDLLRQIDAPALATLLGQASIQHFSADPYARILPHQAWLLGRLGKMAGTPRLGDVAIEAMKALGLSRQAGAWFMLHPVHFHIARDHLVLTDPRQLPLSDADSRALFEDAAPLFADAGMELVWGRASLWFLRADALADLETSAPDKATGHNVDIWMPRGEGERAWRRIHNEVQMAWHAHAVNEEREQTGHKPVNALWCWNARSEGAVAPSAGHAPLAAFVPQAGWPDARDDDGTQVFDAFSSPALADDWGSWLQAMQLAEQELFVPALQALKDGRIKHLRMIFSDDRRLLQADCSRLALKRFWRRPSLASLNIPRAEQAA